MLKPPKPSNEIERLKALQAYKILDTEPEDFYDNITKLASHICETPIALVTFIDDERQWFKSVIGLSGKETTRDEAFCAYAIHQSDIMIVSDPLNDKRFSNNPFVLSKPNIRFYAGAPLTTSDGYGLGTLCVIDNKNKELSEDQLRALDELRLVTIKYLELRKAYLEREKSASESLALEGRVRIMLNEIETKNAELQELSKILSHDLRAPLRGISSLADWMIEDHKNDLPVEVLEQLELIRERTIKLNNLLDSVIEFSKSSRTLLENKPVATESVIQEVIVQCRIPGHINVEVSGEWPVIKIDRNTILQMFSDIVNNAVRFNDKEDGLIQIHSELVDDFWQFSFQDNGVGIDEKQLGKIFDLFVSTPSVNGETGSGLGLSKVKRAASVYGGNVKAESTLGHGTKITILLPSSLQTK